MEHRKKNVAVILRKKMLKIKLYNMEQLQLECNKMKTPDLVPDPRLILLTDPPSPESRSPTNPQRHTALHRAAGRAAVGPSVSSTSAAAPEASKSQSASAPKSASFSSSSSSSSSSVQSVPFFSGVKKAKYSRQPKTWSSVFSGAKDKWCKM